MSPLLLALAILAAGSAPSVTIDDWGLPSGLGLTAAAVPPALADAYATTITDAFLLSDARLAQRVAEAFGRVVNTYRILDTNGASASLIRIPGTSHARLTLYFRRIAR